MTVCNIRMEDQNLEVTERETAIRTSCLAARTGTSRASVQLYLCHIRSL
jgi:hypothetical protein